MILFPAIDILNGQCVRLLHGDFNKVTVYGKPLDMAMKWRAQGAEFLHIVDLDGAKTGESANLSIVKEIVSSVGIPVQLGGGIRTLSDVESRLKTGIKRVILGSACYLSPGMIDEAVKEFGSESIVCGIDAKDGKVAIRGWLEQSDADPVELGKKMYDKGVRYTVYTDISRDGALNGVNARACDYMAKNTLLNVIASGGVKDIADIESLRAMDMYGAILGKSLYDNKLSLFEALNVVRMKS